MPNYWVPTNYFIDWSEWAVNRMKTLTTKDRNREKEKSGGNESIASRFQNADSYFYAGITFSSRGVYAPTFRANCGACYDKESSGIFPSLSVTQTLGAISSRYCRFTLKNFLQQTISMDVDALKELTLTLSFPDVGQLTKAIIKKQKSVTRYDYASNEQIEIDRLVYEAYGLNEDDIQEVENWYARRYPALAAAQSANLQRIHTTETNS